MFYSMLIQVEYIICHSLFLYDTGTGSTGYFYIKPKKRGDSMKKQYEEAEIEVIEFRTDDVIRTSGDEEEEL